MSETTPGSTPAGTRLNVLVEQWFPLLPRSKPVCRSLIERLDRVRRQSGSGQPAHRGLTAPRCRGAFSGPIGQLLGSAPRLIVT
ncbi:MAG: hypothetical protein ACRDSN_09345, partial [Pseudonocardiaceae bacterium]